MGKSETGRAKKFGFARLLEEASCITSVPGFIYSELEKHPLGYNLPVSPKRENTLSHLSFIGYPGTTEGIQGAIRLIGWTLAHDLLGGCYHEVFFLRIIHAKCAHGFNDRQDVYYEVGVRDRLFMTGGCTYYTGSGENAEMEHVISFLSNTYSVPVRRHTNLDFKDYVGYEAQMNKDIDRSYMELRQHMDRWWKKQKKYRNFQVGDIVKWNPDVNSAPVSFGSSFKFSRRQSFEITAVENIPARCSCGIGKDALIVLHPEVRCHMRRRHEAAHHQLVTVNVAGKEHMMSGYYFDTNKLFDFE